MFVGPDCNKTKLRMRKRDGMLIQSGLIPRSAYQVFPIGHEHFLSKSIFPSKILARGVVSGEYC